MRALVPSTTAARVLLGLLIVGLLERIVLMVAYTPAILSYPDTISYVQAASGPIFLEHPIHPAGYAALLGLLSTVWAEVGLVVAVQHVMGLVTAVLAYATARRLGAPAWVALIPAGAYAIVPDFLYFEHSLLSETTFTLALLATLYCAARAIGSPRGLAWLAAAGLLVAVATSIRSVGLVLLPVPALAALVAYPGAWRARLAAAAVVCVAGLGGVLAYAGVQSTQLDFFGITQGGGWALYSRSAPFAQCTEFRAPKGTEGLCETSDWRHRPGPDFYSWEQGSPGRRLFNGPPHNDEMVGSFGRAAILGQPGLYARAVVKDVWRYVDPDAGHDRPHAGYGPEKMAIDLRVPRVEAINSRAMRPLYGAQQRIRVRGAVELIAGLQSVVRVHGLLLLVAVPLGLLGLLRGTARDRALILLFGGCAALVMLVSVALTTYNHRYAVPFLPLLLGAGAVGAHALLASRSPRAAASAAAAAAAADPAAR